MEIVENEKSENSKRKNRTWNWIKAILITITVILMAAVLLIGITFRNNIRTISSIKKISKAPAYQMNYYGDYAIDKYLKQGVGSNDELQDFLTSNLAMGAGKLFDGNHGCSAFFGVTPDGDYIVARNFDTTDGEGCILKADDTEGSKIVGISNIGWLLNVPKDNLKLADEMKMIAAPYMTMDGMNQYGLAVSVFSSDGTQYTADKNKISIFDHTVPIVLLNKAKTVDEAISFLSKYNISASDYPLHYMFCDASGNSAVVEFVKGKMQVVHKNNKYQICSNFILYNNPTLKGFGSDRYNNYDAVLSKTQGVISIEDALKLLQKNTIPGDEEWSVVYNLTDKTISATFYGDYDKVYKYSLK
jgi:Penicillin V acylase and related amidases